MSFCLSALQRTFQANAVGAATGVVKPTSTRSLWTYSTDDAAATVEAAGYFNDAAKQLAVGDVVMCVMAFSGTPVLKSYVVTVNTGSAVTVVLQATAAG